MTATNRRYYQHSADERDRMIRELRLRGMTYRQIGAAVGMSANGVMHALRRMARHQRGLDPRA